MTHPTPIEALVDAVWQVLDDFGHDGKSVCGATKAQLRVAFEPFKAGWEDAMPDYTLEDAEQLLASL